MPFKSSARGAYGPQGQKVIKGPLAPVWVTSGALSNGLIGSAYSVQLSATDDSGDAPTYTLATGSLPSGITLSSSGLLSGTVGGSAGAFTFTVNATDVNGRVTTSSSLSITTISPELYTFSSFTITPNGTTNQNPAGISNYRASIGNPSWANTYLTDPASNGILNWTVPSDGTYRITTAGARGADHHGASRGLGYALRADFSLTKNTVIGIIIGQNATNSATDNSANGGSGGGGGTFVWNNTTNTLLIVGGGGGSGSLSNDGSPRRDGKNATYGQGGTTSGGNWSPGTSGNNGSGDGNVAGTGWNNIRSNPYGKFGGRSNGGFGGGGGGIYHGGGAGGGYNGGGGNGGPNGSIGGYGDGGGGAGSYITGTNQTDLGTNNDNGYVTIQKL